LSRGLSGKCPDMAASDGNESENNDATKPGPANHQAADGLDAPTPPGGPLRSDAPSGSVTPGGPDTPEQPGRPEQQDDTPMRRIEEPIGSKAEPGTLPTGDGVPESSQDQPSDDSGQH
jgi:hypothetical protein